MKKIVLLLSLLVVVMFLVGCTETETVDVIDEEGNIVGEAFRMPSKSTQGLKKAGYSMQISKETMNKVSNLKKIECKQFDNLGNSVTGDDFCVENNYDACAGGSVVAKVWEDDTGNGVVGCGFWSSGMWTGASCDTDDFITLLTLPIDCGSFGGKPSALSNKNLTEFWDLDKDFSEKLSGDSELFYKEHYKTITCCRLGSVIG